MRTLIIYLILIVAVQTNLTAQQIDENTLAINNYFQISNEKPVNDIIYSTNLYRQSLVNLVQLGIENDVYINSLHAGDNQNINQIGNNNDYKYYTYYNNDKSNIVVNQEGDQNSLQIFGENSLMKNAVINQRSNFKSIVIKNFTN